MHKNRKRRMSDSDILMCHHSGYDENVFSHHEYLRKGSLGETQRMNKVQRQQTMKSATLVDDNGGCQAGLAMRGKK